MRLPMVSMIVRFRFNDLFPNNAGICAPGTIGAVYTPVEPSGNAVGIAT